MDVWLNTRYEAALEATDWLGLKAHATIATIAAYQSSTDSATLTVGSSTATGSSTNWTSGLVGQKMYRPGDTATYVVTAVGSTTSVTLDRPYEGNGVDAAGVVYAASAYVFMQNVYALPSDCRTPVTILDPITGFPLTSFTKDGLDASAGPRTLVNDPASWAPYDDSAETSPPVVHQIELYPPPLHARGFPLEYLRSANAFDGGNTSGSPLPFISNTLLLKGVRADIAMHLGEAAKALGYEKEFSVELARLLRIEHQQRRRITALRMNSRFTRHRLDRASRGTANYWGPGAGGPD